ncbi:CHAT domain-containing protein [Sphingomonas sp. Leaf208]|uniref:CHAT domain-containing protein n=1 Tax=Sphingomonas sp. Leaf208 TaxID=1735679 RepID=UPI000ADD2D02|nr:CHAT domain-containing protein [Sphingomonas sp. Leaf208]
MMLTYQQAFPETYDLRLNLAYGFSFEWSTILDWEDEQTVLQFAAVITGIQLMAEGSVGSLDTMADAVIRDLNRLLASAEGRNVSRDGLEYRSLIFLRFIFSVLPMEVSYRLGRRGAAYDWAFLGLATGHDSARRRNSGFTFLPLRQALDPVVAIAGTRLLPRWCITFFLLARDMSIGAVFVEELAACWDILVEILDLNANKSSALTAEVWSALASMTSWAISEDGRRRDEWVLMLAGVWNRGVIPREVASVVATTFITRSAPLTGRSAREWATLILSEFSDVLREHERLQFLVATVDTYEEWRLRRAEIVREIQLANVRAADATSVGSNPLLARDARVDVIRPLIRLLVLEQDLAGAMELLRAWYGRRGHASCDDNVLLVHPALSGGAAVLWPGRAKTSLGTVAGGHQTVVEALQDALKISRNADEEIDEGLEGTPDYQRGASLEQAMMRYYRPKEIARVFSRIGDPRSLVVFPSVSDPLQALLERELGILLPLEVSLAEARTMRPVRSISIWAGFTLYTHLEVEMLLAFGEAYGWAVTVFEGSEDGDADDFRTFYEQSEPDVLWVCGHSDFVPHQLGHSGIVVEVARGSRTDDAHETEILSMENIADFDVPGDGRRLLVLNTCSGATTQGMAGMAQIGLAQSLVGPAQMVAGHLWPASHAVALAFGGLFASGLGHRDVVGAFGEAIRALRDPRSIVPAIEEKLGREFSGAFRIERDADQLSSIMAWGCPVLLT